MTGIALDSFHITPVQLQFIGNTGVTEAVEDDPGESMLIDQPAEHRLHRGCFYWKTYRACHHKVVVLIFISQGFFNEVLFFFPFDQHVGDRLRKEDLTGTAFRLRCFQDQNRLFAPDKPLSLAPRPFRNCHIYETFLYHGIDVDLHDICNGI